MKTHWKLNADRTACTAVIKSDSGTTAKVTLERRNAAWSYYNPVTRTQSRPYRTLGQAQYNARRTVRKNLEDKENREKEGK